MVSTRLHALWPTQIVVVSLVMAFVAERILAFSTVGQKTIHIASMVLLCGASFARAYAYSAAKQQHKKIQIRLLATTFGVLFSLSLFHASSLVSEDQTRVLSILWGIWPSILLVSLIPLLAIEVVVHPVAFMPNYELNHIKHAFERAVGMCLLLICLFWSNFLAQQYNQQWNISGGLVSAPASATQETVQELTKDIHVSLFWPTANDIGDRVERYFTSLSALNNKLHIYRVDHALAIDEAKQAKIIGNGWIALREGSHYEKIRIGMTVRSSRNQLRRLDQNLIKTLLRLSRKEQVIYVSTGHGERSLNESPVDDPRSALSELRKQLETWRFKLRPLGISNGFTEKLPEDTALVLILDPQKPFLAAELNTLTQAAYRKLRMLITVDASRKEEVITPLLAPFNIQYHSSPLANQTSYVRLTSTQADRQYIWSNQYSSHDAVTTMSRHEELATIFHQSSSLSLRNTPSSGFQTHSILTAINGTFRDQNANLARDPEEFASNYPLAAAGTKTSTLGPQHESRVFVLADTDLFSNQLLSHSGNTYLLFDIIKWLQVHDEPIVPRVQEQDVRILHASEQDTLLFYGTVFVAPLLILLLGYSRDYLH